ncbi:hypothetical protein M413DRAFT_449573 [Hebeloma cylindrosporum]|uniref:BTB domain-containing protein n=1 Tax=Hebeloma cylindrosporum TaxID=76867 RepID=A0A0C3BUS7_HEBCY|nr:hypothetical protein M413DRAFT_449573 [Hebeloma cylindrosporum h7]
MESVVPTTSTAQVHHLFNDTEADVIFCSKDGTLFHLQRKYLETNTGAFPGAEFDTRGEITHLTEPTEVLEVLFQFIYPRRHPDIEELEFPLLAAVAEAAEKYEVFSGMSECKTRMRTFLPKHAAEILAHASRHDYPKLIQEAASYLVRTDAAEVIEHLPSSYVVPWLRYQKAWDSVMEAAFKEVLGLRISKPLHHGTRPPLSAAAMSMQGEACHPCVLRMLSTLQDLKALKTTEELQANFIKPRPPMIGCISSSCQYTSIFTKLLLRMKSDIAEIPSFSSSFNWSKPELSTTAQDSRS